MKKPRPTLQLESLEDRLTPVTWPVSGTAGQPVELLGTYGQYQERQLTPPEKQRLGVAGNTNDLIASHVHEGLDIKANVNAPVWAIMDGRVEAIYRDPDVPFDSFIVIRDVVAGKDGPRGWTYKHVVAMPGLSVNQAVTEGTTQIGQIAALPAAPLVSPVLAAALAAYGTHVHIDRGVAGADPPQNGTRDRTMPLTGPYIKANNLKGISAQAKAAVEGLRWQYAPTINPLSEFLGTVTVRGGGVVVDEIRPTVNQIDFRLNTDSAKAAITTGMGGIPVLQVRSNDHYFLNSETISDETYKVLGQQAVATDANGKKSVAGTYENSRIDFVVSAYDRFGTTDQPGTQMVNPASFDFSVTGTQGPTAGVDSGYIQSFDFSQISGGVNDFFRIQNAQSFYEYDTTHKSQFVPTGDPDHPFWYVVTNTPYAGPTPPPVGAAMSIKGENHAPYYWASRGEKGKTFQTPANATKNADAAYPDGLYNVTVNAEDLAGNVGVKVQKVMLTNWKRTIGTDKLKYQPTDAIKVTGGDQYLASQNVDIYVMASEMGLTTNSPLAAGDKKGTATTNANGQLTLTNLGMKAAGNYVVIADYNGDGIYTQGLDAITAIRVIQPGTPPPTGGVALSSSGSTSHFTDSVTFTATVAPAVPRERPAARVDRLLRRDRVPGHLLARLRDRHLDSQQYGRRRPHDPGELLVLRQRGRREREHRPNDRAEHHHRYPVRRPGLAEPLR